MLSCLLRKDPRNRMAFEYLMASHLVNRQLTRFVKRVEGLQDMGTRGCRGIMRRPSRVCRHGADDGSVE